MTDLKSLYGYRAGSPFISNPYLDIETPEGLIDMEATPFDLLGIDNLGVVKHMKAGRKRPYKFRGTKVREIPMQKGGKTYSSGTSETLTNLGRNMASYFLGVKNTSRVNSPYRPTQSNDPKAKYYTWQYLKNDVKDDIVNGEFLSKVNQQQANFYKQQPGYLPFYMDKASFDAVYQYLDYTPKKIPMSGSSINLGQYSLNVGRDDRGRYLSVYDKYDWNLLEGLGIKGNGWEIYDRIYEDEWDKIKDKPKKQKGGNVALQMFNFLFNDEPSSTVATTPVQNLSSTPDLSVEQLNQKYAKDLQDQQDLATAMGILDVGSYSSRAKAATSTSSSTSSTGVVSGDRATYAYNFFQKKGLPAHISAGIVGNLIQESGNFRQDVIEDKITGDKGTSHGIAQWHKDRWPTLLNWAKKEGRNPYSLDSQLEYVYKEAQDRGDLGKVSKTSTPEEAANTFAKWYERPAIIDPNRAKYARSLYK